jgi:hypothetical protein
MAQIQLKVVGTPLAKEVICPLIKAGKVKLPNEGQEFVGTVGIKMCLQNGILTVSLCKPPTNGPSSPINFDDLSDFFKQKR